MELLEGETLAERLERGALPVDEVLRYGSQVAQALDRAHRQGVVHGDLKPGNIMLTRSGVKLLDFGLAKVAEPTPVDEGLSGLTTEARDAALTEEGTILGTFQYMAPEQLEGRDADARSDIFALGVKVLGTVGGRANYADIALSPGGDKVAYTLIAQNGVWVRDLERNVSTRLTFGTQAERTPLFGLNARQLYYKRWRIPAPSSTGAM